MKTNEQPIRSSSSRRTQAPSIASSSNQQHSASPTASSSHQQPSVSPIASSSSLQSGTPAISMGLKAIRPPDTITVAYLAAFRAPPKVSSIAAEPSAVHQAIKHIVDALPQETYLDRLYKGPIRSRLVANLEASSQKDIIYELLEILWVEDPLTIHISLLAAVMDIQPTDTITPQNYFKYLQHYTDTWREILFVVAVQSQYTFIKKTDSWFGLAPDGEVHKMTSRAQILAYKQNDPMSFTAQAYDIVTINENELDKRHQAIVAAHNAKNLWSDSACVIIYNYLINFSIVPDLYKQVKNEAIAKWRSEGHSDIEIKNVIMQAESQYDAYKKMNRAKKAAQQAAEPSTSTNLSVRHNLEGQDLLHPPEPIVGTSTAPVTAPLRIAHALPTFLPGKREGQIAAEKAFKQACQTPGNDAEVLHLAAQLIHDYPGSIQNLGPVHSDKFGQPALPVMKGKWRMTQPVADGSTCPGFMADAIKNLSPATVKKLFDFGANPYEYNAKGWTLIMEAIHANRGLEMVKTLVECGVPVNTCARSIAYCDIDMAGCRLESDIVSFLQREITETTAGRALLPSAPKLLPQYRCAYTYELMKDPVKAASGHHFERSTIVAKLSSQQAAGETLTNPVTGKTITWEELKPDFELKAQINRWASAVEALNEAIAARSSWGYGL